MDPKRQPTTITEEFSQFDPTAEYVMTDVGDVTCTGLAQDKFGNFTGGKVRPENGRFYAVQVDMKVYENKWMDKGLEALTANNFSYVSPSGKELPPDKIATSSAYACLSKGFLPMYIYEQQSGSGKLVFDIPNEEGGKLVHQRYGKENLPQEEFPLDRSGRSSATALAPTPSVSSAKPKPPVVQSSKPTVAPSSKPSSGAITNTAPGFDGALPAAPVDGLRSNMSGTWTGPVTGDSSKYTVKATIRETSGVLTADVEYPELKCSATWTEVFASGTAVSLKEKLKSGKCLDDVTIGLTLEDQGISAFFTGGAGKDIRAVLVKE